MVLKRSGNQHSLEQLDGIPSFEDLTAATRTIIAHGGLDPKEIISRVMEAAQRLMNADRCTLWLVDEATNELWTELRLGNGSMHTLRIPISIGFAGKVAATGEPMNYPFDFYDHPDSDIVKQTDKKSCYRTCSLLCMPVWSPEGNLLGVTQLLNKRRQGDYPDYDPNDWPEPPQCFQDSFDADSQKYMEIFNSQVGVVLAECEVLGNGEAADFRNLNE